MEGVQNSSTSYGQSVYYGCAVMNIKGFLYLIGLNLNYVKEHGMAAERHFGPLKLRK
jgi:hypothetical protein